MEIRPERQEEYVKINGNRCIICNSTEIVAESPTTQDNGIDEVVKCNNCQSIWTDEYRVYHSFNLELNSNDINYCKGDASKPAIAPCIIAHIVNDQGGWGAGFTGSIATTFGSAPGNHYKKTFREQSIAGNRNGFCAIWNGPNVEIIHMFAQRGYVDANNQMPLNMNDLDTCLAIMFSYAHKKDLTVHMPRIGAGLGGGDWNRIEELINNHRNEVPTYVYDLR
jgi:O-acetyl-ADP-ribose deacetylase (regulator of RNase III)